MNLKRHKIILLGFLIFLFSIQTHTGTSFAVNQESGTFQGFTYEYGVENRQFTKSIDYATSFVEIESTTLTKEFTRTVPIRTGIAINDIIWERKINRSMAAPNSSWQLPGTPQNWLGYRFDNFLTNGTEAGGVWYRYNGIEVIGWGTGIFGQSFNLSWFGRQIDVGLSKWIGLSLQWKTSYLELSTVGTETIPMKDWLGILHGQTTQNSFLIKYYDDNGTPGNPADDFVVFEELLIPRFALVTIQTTMRQVSVKETTTINASLSGQYNFSGSWEENLNGQHVSVKDGRNYWFDYFAVINGTVDYQSEGGFSLKGYLSTNITREVNYTSDNSNVPENVRPIGLQSFKTRLEGEWDHKAEETGVFHGQGAIQSFTQVLFTKASIASAPDLAVWSNFNPGRVIGYRDIDGDDLLTAFLNESMIATPDEIFAVGFPEGAHLEGTYKADALADAKVFVSIGDNIIADNETTVPLSVNRNVNVTWGFDPRVSGSGPSDVSLTWKEPVENDGKSTFEWSTTYSDMPMTWWVRNSTTSRVITDPTDITYSYILEIDPVNGEAILESTYQQSEIDNSELAKMVNDQDLSMARYNRDYYLSMTKIGSDSSGSRSRPESKFDLTTAGKDLFSQNFGGSKENYQLSSTPGTNYQAGTSVMNLLTAEGYIGEPTNRTRNNPFTSPVSKRIASALTHWSGSTHTSDVSWIFRENLVITSYPTWKGAGITHDPAYSASYSGNATRENGTGPPDGVPGFSLVGSIIFLAVIVVQVRKRRKQ